MKMLGKVTDRNVWKFLRKTSMMGFLSVKLQTYSVQTATLKRTHHRFFLQYLPKTSCLKKNEKRKSLLFEKKVYDGPTPEQGCSAVVHNPQFYRKSRAHVRPSCRSVESSNILTGKTPQWSLFPEKLQV